MMRFLRFARQKLGRLGSIFLFLLAVYSVLYFIASGRLITSVFLFALYVASVGLAFKLFRVSVKKVLLCFCDWLFVSYVFFSLFRIVLVWLFFFLAAAFFIVSVDV